MVPPPCYKTEGGGEAKTFIAYSGTGNNCNDSFQDGC